MRTNSASSSICWCRAPPKPALKQRLLVPTSSVPPLTRSSDRNRLCLCVVGVSRGARFLRCCRRAHLALPARAAARVSSALSRRCSHCSHTKTFDPRAPAQNWSACAGVRLARSPLGSAAHRCALQYGLLSDCAYACWSWYEARGVLSARPLAGHAPEGKTGCREPHGFANDSHAAAGPCEYRGRSHEARLLSTWSMSAQSKRLAAWRAAERIRRTSSRSSSFTIK